MPNTSLSASHVVADLSTAVALKSKKYIQVNTNIQMYKYYIYLTNGLYLKSGIIIDEIMVTI